MLVLASASPRRRELFALFTAHFAVDVSEADETLPPGIAPDQAVQLLAREKALAVAVRRPGDIVVGADTVVVLDGEILGKPRDKAHAADMLRALSGRGHTVYTGVAVTDSGGCETFAERTAVEFAPLCDRQISAYIATGEPMDKAGAYGIQGQGALFVRSIHGDFYTVMGFPVCHFAEFMVRKYGFEWNL